LRIVIVKPFCFRLAAIVLCVLGLSLLSACGQRGPLYLPKPDNPPAAQTAPAAKPAAESTKKPAQPATTESPTPDTK